MKKFIGLVLILLLLTSMGCAVKAKQWESRPASRKVETSSFTATLVPEKEGKHTFVAFRLILENKTDKPLQIDWNQTTYFVNGKPNGLFWFRGIDPRTMKGAVPPDAVPAKSRFEKLIFPVKLVAYAPVQNDMLRDGGPGIYPGPMPEGENEVALVVVLNGRKITERLTFTIAAEVEGSP